MNYFSYLCSMKYTLYILIYIVTALFCLKTEAQELFLSAPPAPKHEVRAVWLTTLSSLDWPTAKATSEAGRRKQKEDR